ncbi:uncharacterized protein LOC143847895 [Tasmannia lanceolata]|uniref:uncharacterized protein LOC143847895 n=1 Tax=Tasmannia lanceolata TaxID=3420 RepID=UPI0040628F68
MVYWGDFNEIRFVGERFGCRRSVKNMRLVDEFIVKNDLIDLPLSGSRFTWSRGESQSRIDCFLICPGWLNLVPEVIQRSLVHSVSDHCPIILDPRMESWDPPPFKFEIAWLLEKLRAWVKEQRLKDQTRKVWLERRIGEISGLEEAGQGSGNLRKELGRIKEHKGLLLHEEFSRRQKSRVRWLKEGDKNSAYFHAMASVRKRKNRIESLVDNGVEVSGKDEITKVVLWFYKSLYSSEGGSRPTPEHLEFRSLDLSLCMELEKPFEEEEIERGCLYKFLAKVLAEHLKKVLPVIISDYQSAFVAKKQILDCSLITNEAIDYYRRLKKRGFYANWIWKKPTIEWNGTA